jgi:DNA-binding transcriptional MerR regulator
MSRIAGAPPLPPPPPDTKLTILQVARAAGVRVRAIRYYVAQKALTAPEFRSRNTRYDRAFLVRLRALAALRREGLKLDVIVPQLDAASPEELLRLGGYAVPDSFGQPGQPTTSTAAQAASPARTAAQAASPAPTTAPVATTSLASPATTARPLAAGFLGPYRGAACPTERWEHMEICPGVKLLVRAEADFEAWRVAREIVATFAVRS